MDKMAIELNQHMKYINLSCVREMNYFLLCMYVMPLRFSLLSIPYDVIDIQSLWVGMK